MTGNGTPLNGYYDYRLVALSILISILSSYAALDLAGRVTIARGRARLLWLGGGAVAMGTGIWSMHYIGMEALRLPAAVLYDWPTVLLSMLAAIAASGVALYVVSRKTMGTISILIGSVAMGCGIAAMHYIGMKAMRLPAMCSYSPGLVTLSVVLAIVISGVALYLTFHLRADTAHWDWRKGASALLMGVAIPVMHYVGMAAAVFIPMPLVAEDLHHAVNISALGIAAITLATLLMLSLVFVLSIVDRRFYLQAVELRSGEQRYRQIVEAAFDAFVGFDTSLVVEHWNAQAERTFGWTRAEAIGRPLSDFILLDQKANNEAKSLRELLQWNDQDATQARVEVTVRHRTGHEFTAEMALSSVRSKQKNLFAAFVHNVSERKQAEHEREAAKEAAESASRAKGDFLANMSHQIRTPLNGVIGMTELALQTELTQEQREYLDTVRFSAESLLSIINDILDFSRIEAGKVELETVDFDLRDCMESTLKTLALRADEKGLELLCDVEADVPSLFRGDPNRLRQIVVNLVGNAIKFTHEGEVTLHVETTGSNAGARTLHFVVTDTGVGIQAENLESVFDSFSQADTSTTREFGGTGLGLTISRRLAHMMGGRLWVESEPGIGSAFHFTVELADGARVAASSPTERQRPRTLKGARVLVVDDNRTNRRILEGLLTNWGMSPTLASDGEKALAALEEAREKGQPFQLILTDMHMPKMNGLELIERLQSDESSRTAAIMMLTSGGHRHDAERCEQLGVGAYLLKPIRQAELREAILRILGTFTERSPARMITSPILAETRPESSYLEILLAEDNEVNRKLATRLLEKRGHSVDVATNGREALEALHARAYDVVLMDVQMPEMDGVAATAALRAAEAETGRHQPVIAMTALVMKGDRERCMAVGMDGYLAKPIHAQELDEVLEKYIAQKNHVDTQQEESPQGETLPVEETIDTQDLMQRVSDDRKFLAELVGIFREEAPRQLDRIKIALDRQDSEEMKLGAHSLRGALSNLAAVNASALAADIEFAATLGDLASARAALQKLEVELTRAIDTLSAICQESVS